MTRAHGLTFIGPPPEVLERFASKAGTRELLARHGLPTIPGSDGMLRDDDHALAEAERIGYPVLIKPSAGGGGRGMRMVRSPRELQQAITICRSEARAAFGDDSLYLEKWLEDNRHVEVQVIVDRYGNGVHVGERDCSVQRRHQKIVEEAPSPALDDAAAQRARRAGGPRRGRRRLREPGHARVPGGSRRATTTSSRSTAASRWSIRSRRCCRASTWWRSRSASRPASRWATPRRTSQLRGHAIEFRINAEDVRHDFRPQAGVVERTSPPGGPGVRMDSHLYSGYEVPPYYDSLLGKLIVWGAGPDDGHRARTRRARRARRGRPRRPTCRFHRALIDNAAFLRASSRPTCSTASAAPPSWPPRPAEPHDHDEGAMTDTDRRRRARRALS